MPYQVLKKPIHFRPVQYITETYLNIVDVPSEATASPYMRSNQDPNNLPLHFGTPPCA